MSASNFSYWSFAAYGEVLAQAMTAWLYGDPLGNPAGWSDPAAWPSSGRVVRASRTMSFNLGQAFDPTAQDILPLDLTGGANCLVLGRSASYLLSPNQDLDSNATLTPNMLGNFLRLEIARQDGVIETQESCLNLQFGARGKPLVRPGPEFWLGSQDRKIKMINQIPEHSVQVDLTWHCAVLDTGR